MQRRILKQHSVVLLLAVLVGCPVRAVAQDSVVELHRREDAAITAQLNGLESERSKAIERIGQIMNSHPERGANALALRWSKPLMRTGHYKEVSDWTLKALCAAPEPPLSMAAMEYLQQSRIRALLGVGKHSEALSAAKSFYNFARMDKTGLAIQLLAKCLAADPKSASLVEKFKAQQVAGEASTTQPAGGDADSVLKSIKVDPAPYEASIARENAGTHRSLIRKGNRLLLADKPAEARQVFETARRLADQNQLPGAVESIARAIRAEDGTIGRANAYIMEHHPAAAAQQSE